MILSLFSCISSSTEANGIFKKYYEDKIFTIDVSGNSMQYYDGKKQYTKPEYAIEPKDKVYDWCSNCGKTYDDHPWISFSVQGKKFSFDSYFLRCGCCYYGCCCEENGTCIDCCMYSWSLQISEDNSTWKEVHRVERDTEMNHCNEKTYRLDQTYVARFVRLMQNEPCPEYPPCMAINRMEIFGEVVPDDYSLEDDFISFHDDDEDISIIGQLSRNGNMKDVQ